MGSAVKTRTLEISELIAELQDAWLVRLKRSGKTCWISRSPKVFLDILPGNSILIADWYYQKCIRHLNEATPVENSC